jgi:protein phosphatase
MVADGVGGAARGDIASSATVQQMRTLDTHDHGDEFDGIETLVGGIHLAHNRISDLVADSPDIDGTSTTVVAGLLTGTDLVVAHVGDSRAYLLRDGQIQALTRDHSFVQSLVDEGRITEEEARTHPNRNLILRAVDGVHEPNPDTSIHALQAGDRLLFCSDGCCGVLTDEEIGEILAIDNVDHAAASLVAASLDAGSTDNVTVVVAEVLDGPVAEEDEQLPIVVGAAAHPLRATSRPGRLRRLLTEPIDPELARYAPRPPRGPRLLRFALIVAALLLIAAGILFAAYRWSQGQYYIGVDKQGYVTSYRGVPGSIFGHSLNTALWHSGLKESALGVVDREAVRDTQSATSAQQARINIMAMINRNCGPSSTPTTSTPSPRPTHTATPRHTATTPRTTKKPTPTPTPTPTTKPGCPSSP